jgi:hypothetical protein
MKTVLFVLLAAAPASADDSPDTAGAGFGCRTNSALPEGPVALGFAEADLAAPRRACPRTEIGLSIRAQAIIDTPNFYGNLGGQGALFGSWAVRPTLELFAALEALTVGFTQNATLTTTQFTLGHFTAGGTLIVLDRKASRLTGALTGRLLLPTSFEIPGMRLIGGEIGYNTVWQLLGWLALHGGVAINVTAGVGAAASDPRVGGVAVFGAEFVPFSWLAFVLDFSGRLGRTTSVAPALALRFRIGSLGIEAGGTLPVAGTDRHDFLGTLRFSWRFGT